MKKAVLAALILCIGAASFPVQAKTVTIKKYYESGLALSLRIGRADPTCSSRPPCTASQDGRIDIGGVLFEPIMGSRKTYDVTIRVRDDVDPLGKVSMSACEDTDGNSNCTAAGDRLWVSACLARDEKLVLRSIKRDKAVRVAIQEAWGCGRTASSAAASQGSGTRGVVLLSYVQ